MSTTGKRSTVIGNDKPPTPSMWHVDPLHTSATFNAGHLRFGRGRGKFNVVGDLGVRQRDRLRTNLNGLPIVL